MKRCNKLIIYFQKCGETGRQYTYGQLRDHSSALAVRLQTQFGLKQHDVVAICLPNIPEFAIAALATFEAGLIVTSVNPIYTSGNKIIVTDLNENKTVSIRARLIEKSIFIF